jgi:hypothetical protein
VVEHNVNLVHHIINIRNLEYYGILVVKVACMFMLMGQSTLLMSQLGQFDDMCIKYIFAKCIAFYFGVFFFVFGLDILIFTKLVIFNII